MNEEKLLPCPFCQSRAEEVGVSYPYDSTGSGTWFKVVRCTDKDCPLHRTYIRRNEWQKRVKHPDTINLEESNKLLHEVYNLLRAEYPKEYEEDIIKELGELGEPYKILNKIERYLSNGEKDKE